MGARDGVIRRGQRHERHDPTGSGSSAPVDGPGGRPAVDASGVAYTAPPAAADVDLAAASGLRRQVFGFLPYWELVGRVDQAQQRRPVDHRLLLGRRRSRRQPPQEGPRRHEHDRLGRLDELQPDVGDLERPPARHAGRAHGQRVRLDHRPGERPARAARQRRPRGSPSPGRSRPPSAIAAPTASTSTSSRWRAGYADEFVALLKTVRTRAQQGPQGLPAHLRHDRVHRQLPARGLGGLGRGRRDLHHGLRLPHLRVVGVAGSVDPMSGPAYDLADTVRAYTARVSPSADHPRPPVVRPGVVDRRRRPRARRRSAAPSTATAPR